MERIEDSKQKSKAIQVYVANLLVADTDYKTGKAYSGIEYSDFCRYNIKEYADHFEEASEKQVTIALIQERLSFPMII